MSTKISYLALVFTIISAFSGCNDDDHNTSHPDEGGVILTINWPGAGSDIPATYHANVISSSGISNYLCLVWG